MSIQNFWPVPHTTAYEEPARLAAGGYLSVRQEAGGRRRKLYLLTDEGRSALAAWAAEPNAAAPQLRDELMLKVFAGADLAEVRGSPEWAGSERTLIAGIAYHRKLLELMGTVRD
jgi:PadR family transcriptional regulator AphA